MNPKRTSFIKPFTLPINPKSRQIITDFLDSKLSEAEVDISWANNPRMVYDRLHKFLAYNKHLGVQVTIRGETVYLSKVKLE
jgi:hypothetical protein